MKDSLLIAILFYIDKNPGVDAEDISNVFKIELHDAVELTEVLLQKGLVKFQ